MRKILLIFLMFTIVSCSKDDDTECETVTGAEKLNCTQQGGCDYFVHYGGAQHSASASTYEYYQARLVEGGSVCWDGLK
ncbi:MAG TPA: hypothetical protein VF581_10430 [Flavobacterium sp.]|jgi:hypothetical protein